MRAFHWFFESCRGRRYFRLLDSPISLIIFWDVLSCSEEKGVVSLGDAFFISV